MRSSSSLALLLVALAASWWPLGASPPGSVADLCFQKLVRLSAVPLDFDVFEPRGLASHKALFYLSAVETLEAPEPGEGGWSPGRGRGHLLIFNGRGEFLDDLSLGWGDRYHPGGISSDGERLWIPVAENRPDSRTTVFSMDLATRKLRRAFDYRDHLAALVADPDRRVLYAYTWGSQTRLVFSVTGRLLGEQAVENGWIAYRGGVALPQGQLLAAGVQGFRAPGKDGEEEFRLAGLSLETAGGRLHRTRPLELYSEAGNPMAGGAFTMVIEAGGPRLHFVPDRGVGTMYTYAPASSAQDFGPERFSRRHR